MRLRQTPSRRELSNVQVQDVQRPTRRKIMMSRGKAFKKWIGLPKPGNKDHLEMVDIVSKGVLDQTMKSNLPRIREAEKMAIIERRRELREYLSKRGVK